MDYCDDLACAIPAVRQCHECHSRLCATCWTNNHPCPKPLPNALAMPSLSRHRSNFKWGQWEQIRILRKEAYGKVCLARRGSETAIVKVSYKRCVGQFVRDPRGESTLLQKLGTPKPHPNIVQWIAEYEDEQEFCLVLELCRGGSLYDWITASHSPQAARFYFQQVVTGVCFLHREGLAHLNLALENLLIDRDSIKIANFVYARPALAPLIVTDTFAGHKQYMAPELFQVTSFDGQKADIWSLGVVLFALLTGEMPFLLPCASDPAFRLITQGDGLSALKLPPSATLLLSRLLSVDPTSRPSAEEILTFEWLQTETS